jgi:hypothetical protein
MKRRIEQHLKGDGSEATDEALVEKYIDDKRVSGE